MLQQVDSPETRPTDTVAVYRRPRAEAQRRFTRGGFYSIEDVATEEDFRAVLALRGLGRLKEIHVRRKGLRMRLANAALPLLVVGMMQGAFEAFLGVESTVEWGLTDERTLEIEVSPV